jgi:hypothetical protein
MPITVYFSDDPEVIEGGDDEFFKVTILDQDEDPIGDQYTIWVRKTDLRGEESGSN